MNEDDIENEEEEVYYRITPKGVMWLYFLKEFCLTDEAAAARAQELEDQIFKSGYIYVHHTELKLEGD